MNFLTPMPMLLAAGLAVPALLTLYFLRLRRRPVRVSSTMLWEQAAQDLEVNAPWRWIKSSWLLWLHLLILALFLLALGRPTLDAGGPVPSRVILILDRSASMSAQLDGSGTRLDRGKELAREQIEAALGRGAEVALLAADASARLMGPPSRSRSELFAQLDRIEATDRPDKLQAALDLAQTLVPSVTEDAAPQAPAEVVLLSDGGSPTETLTLAGAELRYLPIGSVAENATGNANQLGNVGIVTLTAVRDRSDAALVRLFVRLLSTFGEPTAVPIRIEFDSVDPDTPAGVLRRFAVTVPAQVDDVPGELTRTIELRVPEAAPLALVLELNDALTSDNAAGVLMPEARAPAILLVSPAGAGGGPTPSPFVRDVLEALQPRVLRSVPAATYFNNARNPGDADLIVFDRVDAGTAPVRPSLSFGVSPAFIWEGNRPDNASTPEDFTSTPTSPIRWERSHPTLRDVALNALIVTTRAPLSEAGGSGRVQSLIDGPEGPLAVEMQVGGQRHVVLGFAIADSNWPLQIGFTVFLAQAMEHLAPMGGGAEGRVFTTAAPLRLRAADQGNDSSEQTGRVVLNGPQTLSAPARGGIAELGQPALTGWYDARGAAEPRIPVSLLDAAESGLAVADRVRVAGRSVVGIGETAQGPTELWRWLVLAALGLLAVDWVLYGMRARPARTPDWLTDTIGGAPPSRGDRA